MLKLDAFNAVREAICIGYRSIDTSVVYGNLKEVGKAISSAIADGIVRREDLFISCKLWGTFYRPNLVEQGLDNTLNELGLDYCDLCNMHTPCSLEPGKKLYPEAENGLLANDDVDPLDTWLSIEKLVQKKKCRSIGLANFNRTQTERILDNCTIKSSVAQPRRFEEMVRIKRHHLHRL
ncbi:hypothetical protein GE061_011279 [Apolygus lucorum]|uniref:NADP-dependent oxidoreductase domain-containing protein n=1 Tax=Apolygus lucorum TaxID=248454 RepID=A0A8S9XYF6_APOLU|nr:hypothetical protein GE061_011279 [Apolygus lucorum]